MVSDLLLICSGYHNKCVTRYVMFLELNFLWDAEGVLLYHVVLGTQSISAGRWFPRSPLWQHKGGEVTGTR